jgi:hypothetical protein
VSPAEFHLKKSEKCLALRERIVTRERNRKLEEGIREILGKFCRPILQLRLGVAKEQSAFGDFNGFLAEWRAR